jgi:membrane protein DedA with SNARE-associated domain
MTGLINQLLHDYGYYAVFAIVALEGVGLPLPGETTLIAAALYAGTTHELGIVPIFFVAVVAAFLGDNAGYWLGRAGGPGLVRRYGRFVRLDGSKLRVMAALFQRHGGKVVFWGRFVSVIRTYAAFFAGLNRLAWRRFLLCNAAGGVVWAALCSFGAYALGSAASGIGTIATFAGVGLVGLLSLVMFAMGRRSIRRLAGAAAGAAPPADRSASGCPVPDRVGAR